MSDVADTAAGFVRLIVDGNTEDAHELLADRTAADIAASELQANFDALSEEMGGVTGVGQPMVISEDWPHKTENDVAIVYVPLEGDVFSEAITVTVSTENDDFRISAIEWGRP